MQGLAHVLRGHGHHHDAGAPDRLGGVVKNVIALAVGICDGQGLGDNSKASVITRGLAETTRLAVALGGDPATMAGLAGLGDLVATCASPLSRNRTAGRHIGTGLSAEEAVAAMRQTAEGIKSVSAIVHAARAHGVEMPISELMDRVVAGDVAVDRLAELLLAKGYEVYGLTRRSSTVTDERIAHLLGIMAGGAGVPQCERGDPVGVDVLGGALELGEGRDGLARLGRRRVVDLEQEGLVRLDDEGAVIHLSSLRTPARPAPAS